MQKCVSFIIVLLAINLQLYSQSVFGSAKPELNPADSLFQAKQYTQALKFYDQLFDNGLYSPSMLLRMGYIQEGLGHLGESLFFLNSYFGTTFDNQALNKMEEIAKKNQLEGYKFDEEAKFFYWIQKHYFTISYFLCAGILLTFIFMIYLRLVIKERPIASVVIMMGLIVLLFLHINFNKAKTNGVVIASDTYLMSSPSAGGDVVEIIGEGHKLEILGKEDVWFRVIWKDKTVYVKQFLIRPIPKYVS